MKLWWAKIQLLPAALVRFSKTGIAFIKQPYMPLSQQDCLNWLKKRWKTLLGSFSALVISLAVLNASGFLPLSLITGSDTSKENLPNVMLIADFSGPFKATGEALKSGFEVGLKQSGTGSLINLVSRDDRGSPEVLDALADGAMADYRLLAVIGPVQRLGVDGFVKAAEEAHAPLILPVGPPRPLDDSKWVFSMQPNLQKTGEFIGHLLLKIKTPKRVAVVMSKGQPASPYFSGITQSLVDNNVQLDSTEVIEIDGLTDAKTGASRLLSFDLLFLDLPRDYAQEIVKGLRDQDHKGLVVGLGESADPAFAQGFDALAKEQLQKGYYTQNMLGVTPYAADIANEVSRPLSEAFVKANGRNPDWAYAYGYDTALLLGAFLKEKKAALKKSNLSPEELREALRAWLSQLSNKPNGPQGFTGPIRFNQNQEREIPPRLVQFKYGNKTIPYFLQFSDDAPVLAVEGAKDPTAAIINGLSYRIVPAVFSGIHIRSIRDISLEKGNYFADFDLWFRSNIKIDPEDIEFLPTPQERPSRELIESEEHNGIWYSRVRFKGKLPLITRARDLGLGTLRLNIGWIDHKLDSSNLRFVVDIDSLSKNGKAYPIYEQLDSEGSLERSTGYDAIASVLAAEDVSLRALGDPRATAGQLRYSTTDLKITLGSSTALLPKASIAASAPPTVITIVFVILCLLLSGIFILHTFFKKLHFQSLFIHLLIFITLVAGDMAFFTSELAESISAGWLILIRYSIDLAYYGFIAAIINDVMVRLLIRKYGDKEGGLGHTMIGGLRFLVYIVALGLYYTTVLQRDLLPILATSSVILTVVGLAMRELIFDFMSGIAIALDDSLLAGNWVTLNLRYGRVTGIIEQLGWRYVKIRSRDNVVHLIPNSNVYAQVVSNFSLSGGYRRVDVNFTARNELGMEYVIEATGNAAIAVLPTIEGAGQDLPVRVVCEQFRIDESEMKVQFYLKDDVSFDSARTKMLSAIHHSLLDLEKTHQIFDIDRGSRARRYDRNIPTTGMENN